MKKIFFTAIMAAIMLTSNAKDKKGVLMTVAGEEIPTSEFEYLYEKNLSQQAEPQSLDDYLELFKIYRLKVAEAKAEGKDTTENFKKEIAQYKRELLEPYMVDSTFIYQYIETAGKRDKEEVEASHIMLTKSQDPQINTRNKEILDSLRVEIQNGASFNQLAKTYSQDKSVLRNEGYLGYIVAGRYPYAFETAVYETPSGEISEIIESPVGLHLVLPGKKRPSRGKVEVSHIMKLVTDAMTDEQAARQKEIIDSIYNIVSENPELFSVMAERNSDDKGTARKGGMLPLFGTGEMVPEFEAAAFSLNNGEISKPVRSAYGWHIIMKHGSIPQRNPQEVKAEVLKRISNPQDPRFGEIERNKLDRLKQKFNGSLSDEELILAEEDWQYTNNPEYRNLVNEYTDGSMLYEVSLDKVWNRAMQDNEGLENYFQTHRDKYKWDQPYAKGVLVQAKTDSIGNLIKSACQNMSPDSIVRYVKKNFSKEAVAEKVLLPKGTNPMVDNIMFDGTKTKSKLKDFQCYFMLDSKLIEEPEELADVKAAVTVDYQEQLESDWVADLKNKYPITINNKELKNLHKKKKKGSFS